MKRIAIDHREQLTDLPEILSTKYGFDISYEQLKLGDYFLSSHTVVERKTIKDFCHSIVDTRLFSQAFRLAGSSDSPIIVIEGRSFLEERNRLPMNAIRGALISLAQTYRIPVLRAVDEADTAWHLNQLFEHQERIGRNTGVRRGPKSKRIEYQKQNVLCSLPSIGSKMAQKLLEHFGSVQNVIKANKDELACVDGIGERRAAKICDVIREDSSPYLF